MAAVWVSAPALGFKLSLLHGFSEARELLQVLERNTGLSDFYVVCNGRVLDGEQRLRDGAVYHLEPRLRGGKGGFGSMLRALGAQIEKTTNREACRDLSGRRLRDVNHEKEMAEWLKKQSEREAEKEQRRLERLQKKLSEPKHHFSDSKFTQQCHELSERLEDSVMKGLQASGSSVVKPESSKPGSEKEKHPNKSHSATFSWTGLDLSSDEDPETDPESDPEQPEAPLPGSESAVQSRAEQNQTQSHDQDLNQSTKQSLEKEPQSAESSLEKEPQSAKSSLEKEPQSTEPSLEKEPQRAEPSLEKEPQRAEPSLEKDPQSAEPSLEKDPQSAELSLLDLNSVSCPEDLEALGLNVLKEELMKRGAKCGGTLSERAKRLYSVRGKRPGEMEIGTEAKKKKGQ